MKKIKGACSLRSVRDERLKICVKTMGSPAKTLSVAALLAAAGIGAVHAEPETKPLPEVTVEAPQEKPRAAARPTAAQSSARARARRAHAPAHSAPAVSSPSPADVAAAAQAALLAHWASPLHGGALGGGPFGVEGYVAQGTSSATKTNTPVMDIPQSLTILTKEQLKDRDSLSLGQALTYVPGVTVTGGEGNKDQVVIRGQSTSADFYKDGVRDDAEYFRDLYNIQAVEVLKGPSALIFGRGGGGGVVNRVTKKADGTTIHEVETSFGSFGRKRVTIDMGQAVSDTLAVRLNGLYEQSYGFRNFFDLERFGINPALTFKPEENTAVMVSYEHFMDRRTVDRGIPSLGLSSFIGGLPASAGAFFPGHPAPTPRYTFFGDANPSAKDVNFSKVEVDYADLNIEHKTAFGLEIRNHTVYANYAKHYSNTFPEEPVLLFEGPPGGQLEIEGYTHRTPRENIFNQTDLVYRFQMTPEIRHTLLAGAEVGHQNSASERDLACFGKPDNNFLVVCDGSAAAVDVPFLHPTVYYPVVFNDLRERRYTDLMLAAGYVQDQMELTKYVDVIAGVRFDRFDLKFRGADFPRPPGAEEGGATEEAEGEVVDTLNQRLRRVDNVWSPRFGVVLKPSEQLSLYGAYSRSFLPMASDQFVVLTPSLAALGPQGFENFEIGFKAQLLPRLLFTGALYQLNRTNQPLAVGAFHKVVADTSTRGGEIGLVGYLTDEWQASLGYGHQSAKVVKSDRLPNPADPFAIDTGKVVPNVPQDTFSFWNKYDVSSFFDAGPGVVGLGAGVVYNAKFFPALDNAVIVPGYARVDGAAFIKLSENVSARLNIENILGAKYFAAATSNNNILPGAPRSAFVTITARY